MTGGRRRTTCCSSCARSRSPAATGVRHRKSPRAPTSGRACTVDGARHRRECRYRLWAQSRDVRPWRRSRGHREPSLRAVPGRRHRALIRLRSAVCAVPGRPPHRLCRRQGRRQRSNCGFTPCIQGANKRLPGTEGAKTPFWSSDSQWIGFFAANSLKKVRVSSGLAQVIATNVHDQRWRRVECRRRDRLSAHSPGGLSRVSGQGGPVSPVITRPTAASSGRSFWGWPALHLRRLRSRQLHIASLDNEPPRT